MKKLKLLFCYVILCLIVLQYNMLIATIMFIPVLVILVTAIDLAIEYLLERSDESKD